MAPQLFLAQKKARMGGGGSSGVHAMDGQSGDGAREGETLGKGCSHPESETLGKGGSHPESNALGTGGSHPESSRQLYFSCRSDANSDNSDDHAGRKSPSAGEGSSAGGSLPSYAPTEASGIDGDPNADDTGGRQKEMRYEPDYDVDGEWGDQTPVRGKPGAWGIVCGNWGGKWHDEMMRDHMDFDLKSSAGTILLLQEATEELLQHLRKPGADGIVAGDQETHGDGGRKSWEQRPTAQFCGFRGQDWEHSILICARTSVVKGIRLLLVRVRHDGPYKKKFKKAAMKPRRQPVIKMAITKWMVASCRMRFWALGEQDTITFMCVHLNHMTAKKEINNGSQSLKRCWDEIVEDITKHGVRIFTGDLNMQLFSAVAELRARGLQANLAAWYPWRNEHESVPRIDSCAVIVIGPCEGIRMTYDCSVLGINAPERPSSAWRNMELVTTDDKGREISRKPFEIRTFSMMGSGFPLASYRPQHREAMKQLVTWTFEGVTKNDSPAVVGVRRASARDQQLFPWTVDQELGSASWTWPSMPPCRQKLIDIKMFDPQSQYFKRGGHMPLMVFVGGHNQQRRTKGACARRNKRAEERGYGAEKRGWKDWSCGNDWSRGSADTRGDGDDWREWQDWRGAWSSDANPRSAGNSDGAWHAWSNDDIDNWRGAWSSDDNWRAAWDRLMA